MTIPETNQALTDLVRTFLAAVRKVAAQEGPDDPVDRVLAAATVVIGAAAIAWPRGRKLPGVLSGIITIARQIWGRRHWWVPAQ